MTTDCNESGMAGLGAAPWLAGIYQEVDGFYYYNPPGNGSYAAHTLRAIADKLDEMNKPWSDQIERELNPANVKVSDAPDSAAPNRK